MEPLILMVFGYTIIRAVKHTEFVSRGKGIAYVFMLFGLVSVYGSYYVCSHSFGSCILLLPAVAMGLLSIASKAGQDRKALMLITTICGLAVMTAYACMRMYDPWHFLFVLSFPLFFLIRKDWATFVLSLLTSIGFLVFLI
jgi:hypothetical protein